MIEVPIIVSTNELTVAGMADTIDLELDLGPQGQRGSKIFSGSGNPNDLPTNSPYWGGYTDFYNGDTFISTGGAEIGNFYQYTGIDPTKPWGDPILSLSTLMNP